MPLASVVKANELDALAYVCSLFPKNTIVYSSEYTNFSTSLMLRRKKKKKKGGATNFYKTYNVTNFKGLRNVSQGYLK